jgi:4-hydroxy-tetrahydrodipicolinate synthase
LPIIVYNVPSRTGVNLEISALEQLSKTENIVGIKEASDSAERLISLGEFGDELYLYAGNDSSVYTVLSLGGQGVISVVSNILPEAIGEICKSYERGEQKEALKLQLKLLPFIRTLFLETNPAPIKYAMSRKWEGLDLPRVSGELRLPLSEVTDATARSVERELSAFLNSRSK